LICGRPRPDRGERRGPVDERDEKPPLAGEDADAMRRYSSAV
jgi:hypothetical protein